jgi:hypothetical protein
MSWKSTALAAAMSAAVTPAAIAADDTPEPLRLTLAGHDSVRAHMRAHERAETKRDLVRRATRLGAPRGGLRSRSIPELRRLIERIQDRLREQRRYRSVGVSPALAAIAACESGGDPSAIGGAGMYRGKYQFSFATWQAVGGSGDPAAASEAEQNYRAALLYSRAGPGQWPVCGR